MTLRIMGHTQPGFLDRVEAVLRIHLPELPASAVAVHPSRGGKYLSVTAQVTLDSKPQLDALYKALRQVDGVISVF
jgi:putative lipoic acid-binding regulatory protein